MAEQKQNGNGAVKAAAPGNGDSIEAVAARHARRGGAAPPPRREQFVCIIPTPGGVAPSPVQPPLPGGVAPPMGIVPRELLERYPEMEETRRSRAITVISRLIMRSDPTKMLELGTFSREDVIDAAYQVASFWIRTGHPEKAEILMNTYGLKGEGVRHMASAPTIAPEPKDK